MSPLQDQELLSRHHRGDHQHADERSRAARDFPHVGVRISGQGSRGHRDRQEIAGRDGPRGQRSKGGRSRARHGAARRCRRRLPALVAALRSRAVGRLRHSGRDRRHHRQRAPAGARRPAEATRTSIDVTAHDAYLKGMYALNKWTDDSMRQAIADFRDAIAHDSGFAPAYAALAEGLTSGCTRAGDPRRQARPCRRHDGPSTRPWSSTRSCRCAQGARPDRHEPRLGPQRGAEEGLTRALQLGPGSATAHLWNAWRLALLERRYDDGARRAGRGRATGSARSAGEDAHRLRPSLPSRLRSRDRAVREGAGAGAVLRLCALCAG